MKEYETFDVSELVKVDDAFEWTERPDIGTLVQLNSGSSRMKIINFYKEEALCANDDGTQYVFNWRMLRPWITH